MLSLMECQLGKRVVLVTGGAVRIGAAVAEAMAGAGWGVVVHAHRSWAEAGDLCGRLRAWRVGGDLSLEGAAAAVFAEACDVAGGRLDAVVNNAAVFPAHDDILRINTEAPIELTRCLWAHLRGRGARGGVVQMLDQRIAQEAVAVTAYVRSKVALAAFVREAAVEMAPVLRVNAVAPGAVLLPASPDAREPAGMFPLGVRPTPAQVADAVRWLLEAEAVTGQTLFVDGGQHLCR